jgi:hypothetical protein
VQEEEEVDDEDMGVAETYADYMPTKCEYSLEQLLCFWTLSIVLSLCKNTALFIFQNTMFWRLDSSLSSAKTYSRLEIGTSSVDWAQMSRVYLKMETESSLRNIVF